MSDNAAIRLAREGEAEAVAALVLGTYRHYIPRIGREPAPIGADYRALIARRVVYILPGDAGPRGLIVAYPDADALFIENIAVAPAERGRGLGTHLMSFAEALARARDLTTLTLYTHALMTENVHYYGKLGFVETARRVEGDFDRVYMRKALDRAPGTP